MLPAQMEETTLNLPKAAVLSGALMLVAPSILVGLVYFVCELKSSTEEFWRLGIFRFLYNAWTAPGSTSYDMWIWIVLLVVYTAAGMLLLPGDVYYGPVTNSGHKPVYRNTAVPFYVLSMAIAGYVFLVKNIPCWPIYRMFPGITVGLTFFGLLASVLLYVKGNVWPSPGEHGTTGSRVFDFYWGLELYPRIGKHWDIKQWAVCRVTVVIWQFLVFASWKAQVEHSGWNWLMAASAILQSSYILKCFLAEDWYIVGFEFPRDRAGYYLTFGSMSFQAIFYSLTSMYLVEHCPESNAVLGLTVLALGFAMTFFNYWADRQKIVARTSDGKCIIWGSPAKVIRAKYLDQRGNERTSILLASGFWSISRHMNYFVDMLGVVCWALPAGTASLVPHLLPLFAIGFLFHRSWRDEQKCSKKYKQYWTEYCSIVKYRFIPFLF
ncbi:unnamed protein product [Ixodes hexagonus]